METGHVGNPWIVTINHWCKGVCVKRVAQSAKQRERNLVNLEEARDCLIKLYPKLFHRKIAAGMKQTHCRIRFVYAADTSIAYPSRWRAKGLAARIACTYNVTRFVS